jgi:putative membrane protein
MILTNEELSKVEMAVRAVENTTSGEVVPVFLKQSDAYPAAHGRMAIFLALITPIIFYYLDITFSHPLWPLFVQAPALVVGYFLAYIPRVKKFFSLKEEIDEEVHQKALEVFYQNKISNTKDRTGILIMVSLLEHRVEILADLGINEKVEKDTWKKLLVPFISQIKKGKLADGMVDIITTCGVLLSQHFPREDDDENELSNKIIVE